MVRPKSKELTDRELEVMRVFWEEGEATAEEARHRLEATGIPLAYVTVANVVRQLESKGFLNQKNDQRPFIYIAKRSFEDVSSRILGNMLQKLFGGSREKLLVQLLSKRQLSQQERRFLEEILEQTGEEQ